ncbi:hypothetical protein Pelo_16867 [Pelomyxa schiedti]|nr:hypothetical protein Pelo_16867 [Pelomyxa schiedti]
MKPTATIRPVIEARSQFVGFACSGLSRCGRGSPARRLSHNRALCEQFGRDWVVGCSRWVGTTVMLPLVGGDILASDGKTSNFHVFMGLSATLGVVSCKCMCLGDPQATTRKDDDHRFAYVEECVGYGRFVEGSFLGSSRILNSEGEVLAKLKGERLLGDLFGVWVSNKRWLVRVMAQAAVKKVIVWRMDDNGVPVSPCGVVVRCTVPLSEGCGVRLSPFDPCGDEIVFVGQQQVLSLSDQPLSTISFVDLEKSIEAGVTVVVSNKTMSLPHSTPFDLIWSSPSTILILYRDVRSGFRVFNTVTGEIWSFSAELYTKISTVWPSHITALRKSGGITGKMPSVCEVYSVSPSSDLSRPSCCYYLDLPVQQVISSLCRAIYCTFQMPTPPTTSSSPSRSQQVSIGDLITGRSLAVITYNPQPPEDSTGGTLTCSE